MQTNTKAEIQTLAKICSKLEYFVRFVLKAKPTSQQLEIIKAVDENKKRIAVKSGHGCFGKDTPIMLYNGEVKAVQDIVVGDILMGDDSEKRRVLSTTKGRENLYKFTFNDGASYIFNESHILVLIASRSYGKQKKGDITEISVREWLKWSDRKKRTNIFFKREVLKFENEKSKLLIEPYILGIWLGGSTSAKAELTLNINDYTQILKDEQDYKITELKGRNCVNVKLNKEFKDKLRALNLLQNKHIPKDYLFSTYENRLKILSGLIEGHLEKIKNTFQIEIIQKNENIANGILFLARSVGIWANLKKIYKSCNGKKGQYYRITLSQNAEKLPLKCDKHKKDLSFNRQRTELNCGIKSVESLGVGDYYGFTIDKNHRFLSGDFYVLRNTGKSTALSWICIWWGLFKADAKIPITAPSSPQLMATLMPEIKKWINKLPKIFKDEITIKADEIDFKNGNFIILRTARKESPEALQGFHATNLLYLIDEGSGVADEIFEVINGAMTGAENTLIMVGNPTRTSGYFYDAFHKNKELFETFTLNAEKSENVSKEQIDRARIEYGLGSDAYKVRILGEFPSASSDGLFSVELIDNAVVRENASKVGAEIWGLDVAEFGDDNSILCKRKGFYVRPFIAYQNLDAEPLSNAIMSEYKNAYEKPVAIYIDTIGVGAGVWSILYSKGLPVYRADVRTKTYEQGLFNKRIEIYKRLKDNLELLKLPNDKELIGELSALRYEITANGLMKLENKKDTKKRLGRSPDRADSLAITFYDEIDFIDEFETDYNEARRGKAYENKMQSDILW